MTKYNTKIMNSIIRQSWDNCHTLLDISKNNQLKLQIAKTFETPSSQPEPSSSQPPESMKEPPSLLALGTTPS